MGKEWQNLSRITISLALFVVISLFLHSVSAENQTYPTANQNLNPTESWRSTEFCLMNLSSVCQGKTNYSLTHSGWLNVTHEDGPKFCEQGGCSEHTRAVLLCLYEVRKDYKFENKATLKDLNDTISSGCNSPQGFTGVSKYSTSHGFRLHTAAFMTALSTAALLFITF